MLVLEPGGVSYLAEPPADLIVPWELQVQEECRLWHHGVLP